MGKHDKDEPASVSDIRSGSRDALGPINDFVRRINKPETLVDHLQRIGVPYWISPAGTDSEGNPVDGEHLVIPWKELMDKEYEYLKEGGPMRTIPPRANRAMRRRNKKQGNDLATALTGLADALRNVSNKAPIGEPDDPDDPDDPKDPPESDGENG